MMRGYALNCTQQIRPAEIVALLVKFMAAVKPGWDKCGERIIVQVWQLILRFELFNTDARKSKKSKIPPKFPPN
jgi:hypothetical protein